MPVVDGVFEARTPLCLAEQQVDFLALYRHIIERRRAVERSGLATARRIGLAYADFPLRPVALVDQLAARLERSLAATARYGHAQARRELVALRAGKRVAQAAYHVPHIGQYAALSAYGLAAVLALLGERAHYSAGAVAYAVEEAQVEETDPIFRGAAYAAIAQRALHNHVLELVGEALNMGRSAGVLSLNRPPSYAMRSEQLDKAMCEPCGHFHGEIYEVGSNDYFGAMPPTGCLGGGRCRGIMVFGDGPLDVRAPEPSEEELARIRDRPRRRAA